MLGLFKKVIGTAQSRILKKYWKIVHKVNECEKSLIDLNEDELKETTLSLKKRYQEGASLDSLLPEAYALVKVACRQLFGSEVHVSGYTQKWDMIPYDVQILGGISMHYGSISEMMTGEGKTLTASMPLFLNALSGEPVHLVTVNDYLAKRDCEWIGAIFKKLGLTVEALTSQIPPQERKKVYAADIVYGTSSEFGFDYLRDNSMAHNINEQCQRGHFFAIVDEIDSILIDEARTPLIISGPSSSSRQMYDSLKGTVSYIVKLQRDYCNKLATDARKVLDKFGLLVEEESEEKKKFTKAEDAEITEAYKKIWLVGKGTPQNKVLKRLKEHPDIRVEIDKWETYFHGDPNKEERLETLAQLYIIVDERNSEFELTDKGIQSWSNHDTNKDGNDDFTMLDLGHEYAKIDQNEELDDQDRMQKKVEIREEDAKRKERAHNLRQLFRAHLLMEKDVDYIIDDKKIVIIDENTGRPQPGRRFSDGLHQSIEAKENVPIQQETQTYATITLQNYFRMYDKLAGMTGTAMTEANEFKQIYEIDVLEIPTNRKCVRDDLDDEIYMTEREKYNALIKDITEIHATGRPILIGTESVEVSEKLGRILRQNKLPYTVLNAKNHAQEAEIIANAGQNGAITVATNMAGRGTDIKLAEGIAELGGLHVIGTTRHQSRRIDRQLRGRCARQGDPGSSKFYVSFEDSLMRLFTSPKLTLFLQRFRPPEGEPISAPILNRSIETAQKRIEQRNYSIRKHTLEYDDVMNKQRQEIYTFRNEILSTKTPVNVTFDIMESICERKVEEFFSSRSDPMGWNAVGFVDWIISNFPVSAESKDYDNDYITVDEIKTKAVETILDAFKKKLDHEAEIIAAVQTNAGKEVDPIQVLEEVIKSLLIGHIDRHWQQHLLGIDHLRTDVNLRVVGQKDPLLEFKHEAFALFDSFSTELKVEIAHSLFKFEMIPPQAQQLKESIQRLQTDNFPRYYKPKQKLLTEEDQNS
ncbi:MAG: Protein translocase subunit SecA [Chlamydiia bacterium]|nr:Protein translocase subunit SecA [Chlamydiia bacterium]